MSKVWFGLILSVWLGVSLAGQRIDPYTYVPVKAAKYIPTVQREQKRYFPQLDYPHYLPGLIEQESCITLTHSRCFNPYSELKNSREQGIGLGQLTRAFNANGTTRFDSLTAMRTQYPRELSQLDWDTIRDRPDLQVRAIVLMSRDNYKRLYMIPDSYQRLKMTDAAYNAGYGRVKKDRTKCGLMEGCDPKLWDDNVEDSCTASRVPIKMYGNKSPCRINREHVSNVFDIRMNKYSQYY